jgi:hypothetical protein
LNSLSDSLNFFVQCELLGAQWQLSSKQRDFPASSVRFQLDNASFQLSSLSFHFVSVNGQPTWREIVGVVHATRHFGLEARQLAEVYIPYAQSPDAFMVLTVRYRGDADQMIRACRREVGSLDPEQAGFPMTRIGQRRQ